VFCSRHGVLVLSLFAFLGGCARRAEKAPVERVAVLRFENLGAGASEDWMGRAFSEVIAEEISAAPGIYAIASTRIHAANAALGPRPVSAPGISAERAMALAAGANRIGYGEYWTQGGHLETRLTIADPRTGRTLRVIGASAAPGDVISAASALAHALSGNARPFGTGSREALQAWVQTLELAGGDVAPPLDRAFAADPDFGPPYRILAQWKAQHQDVAGALALLARAQARPGMSGLERARMSLLAATLRNDPAARQSALASLLGLEPNDPPALRALGEIALTRHEFTESMQAFDKALSLEPDDITALNLLGYAAAYAGYFEPAVQALRRYEALRPAEANPLDSLGDIHLAAGRLKDAETFYLAAWRKAPGFLNNGELFKAAMARLMAGDRTGADEMAKQWTDARAAARDPLVDFCRAEWASITGRRDEGYRLLQAIAAANEQGPARELAARAYAELAEWELADGRRAEASRLAEKSAGFAGPAMIGLSNAARFLAQPSAPAAEWEARTARLVPGAPASPAARMTLAYALLLDRHFEEAAAALKPVYENTLPASEENAGILLAWALVETGHARDAAGLLRFLPVPPPSGPGALMSLYFPRFYELRSKAAEAAGHGEEARTAQNLYRQICGAR